MQHNIPVLQHAKQPILSIGYPPVNLLRARSLPRSNSLRQFEDELLHPFPLCTISCSVQRTQ